MKPLVVLVCMATLFLAGLIVIGAWRMAAMNAEIASITERLSTVEEETLAFPGSATAFWRQSVKDSLEALLAQRHASPTPPLAATRTRQPRTPSPRTTPKAKATLDTSVITPYLIDVAAEIVRGVQQAHPSWNDALVYRYAAAAVGQYISSHGGVPTKAVVNRLLDEAVERLAHQQPGAALPDGTLTSPLPRRGSGLGRGEQ